MSTDDVVLPKNWDKLTHDEQKEWIKTYYMPKAKIPEPILSKTSKVAKAKIKLSSGETLKFPHEKIHISKPNPNIVREFEFWVDKWLITVFHDKGSPHYRYIGISNPHSEKWIAQELNSEILNKLYIAILKIKHKYGLWNRNKLKSRRKNRDFPLSIRDSNRGRKQ